MKNLQQSYREEEELEDQEILYQPNIEILYLRKLYFMTFLQFLICLLGCYWRMSIIEQQFSGREIYLIGGIILLLSYLATFCKKTPLNILIYLVFIVALYCFFICLTVKTNADQSFLVQFLIIGQILGQFIFTLQHRNFLYFHQGFSYIIISGLIVFQLFVIYSIISFHEMLISLLIIIIYGAMLIYGTQTNLKDYNSSCGSYDYYKDAISGSVRLQFDIVRSIFHGAQLMKEIMYDNRKLVIYQH